MMATYDERHIADSTDADFIKMVGGLEHNKNGFQRGEMIQLEHGAVNYKLFGLGDGTRPLVVTLHGLMGSMSTFGVMAQDLVRKGFDVLTFDLFGFGLSDSPRKKFNADFFARQTMELVSALRVPEDLPLHIVGFSMGGLIAMELARRFPQRTARLLLIAPAGLVPLSRLERSGIKALRAVRAMHIPAATWFARLTSGWEVEVESFEPDMQSSSRSLEIAHKNACMFRSDPEKYLKAWMKSVRDMQLSGNQDLYRKVAQSGVEVMFVWGDSDSTVPLHEIQDELRGFFPTAPVMVVRGAGHALMVEHSTTVARYANRFFSNGETGVTPA
mmetsp:Transcript_51542/g.167264  ORF Transcript_51542/g.167264 Transcript_51542/m.167264 type:complete len:329 (-) Transcript_51542:105-1091(-)